MSHLEDATQTAGETRSGAAGDPAGATPRQVARDGREAVRLAVRAVYGDAAVGAAAVADGLAFAGRHAAVVALDPGGAGIARPRAPWVLHRVGEDDGPDGFEVEFAADDAQDAVDHVVVARAVAAGAGFPVACRIDPVAADRLALVRIPTSAPTIDAAGAPPSIADAVTAACDAVAARTGRAVRGRVRFADGTSGYLHERDGRHAVENTPAPARPASKGAGRSVVVGASPDGAHAERFLLDVATAIAGDAPLALTRGGGPRDVATLAIDDGGRASGAGGVDLLVLGHPSWLRRAEVVSAAREGATVVVLSAPADPAETLAGLPATARAAIVERRLRVAWSPASGDDPDAVLGAVLRAGTPLHAFAGGDPSASSGAPGVRRGADTVVGPAELDADADPAGRDPDFAAHDARPVEPAAVEVDDDTAVAWRDRIRRFHAGAGAGASAGGATWPAAPLRPAAVVALETRHGGPVLVLDGDDGPGGRSFRCWMRDLLGARLNDFAVLSENLDLLAVAATRAVADGPSARPVGDAFDALADVTRRGLDVSDAGAEARDRELERLREALPGNARLVRADAGAPLATYLAVLRADRGTRREAFLAECRALAARLRELLQSDDAHAPATADKIRDAVGGMSDLFDTEALSKSLGERRGPTPLEEARRGRIERMLAILESDAERVVADGDVVVVHDGSLPAGVDTAGVRPVEHPHALEAAAGLHDGIASRHVPWFRAIRAARLEVESAYEPARHDAVLASLDARGLSAEEAYVLPTVAVVIRPDRVRGAGLAALSDVLRSGRPVHVLIAADPLAADAASSFATHATGLGYVAAAHREAFVLESTLARPRHLVDGLRRMVEVLRPAAAVVSVPAPDARTGDRRLDAALDGRATVCFRYDAGAGVTWADRFALDGNPQPERPWPRHDFAYTDASGDARTRSEALTFAHAAALAPGHRGRFLVVPREAWSDEQVEIAEWLTLSDGERRRHAPFVWIVADDGALARAVVTRELARETLDRMRAWRTLQELAGTDNEHARRAAEAARRDALVEAEAIREELERRKDEAVEQARTTAAAEAMDRLVQSLMNLDALPAAAPGPAIAPAAPADTAADAVVEPPPAEADVEEDDEELVDEAYIDSALCTSCQECINLNPRMYRYDGNKQAFIADVEAGTFEELVKGAEKCPARCIHPGSPRAGDPTATDAMVARAAKFN